jgi:hypothetical protein
VRAGFVNTASWVYDLRSDDHGEVDRERPLRWKSVRLQGFTYWRELIYFHNPDFVSFPSMAGWDM